MSERPNALIFDEGVSASISSVDGIDVHAEGKGPSTVVMLHGYPDSHRLWDGLVAHLKPRHRCVRFTLPGFDLAKPARTMTQAQIIALIDAVADRCSRDRPITLLMHDWGSHFGYQYAARHPQRVARIVSVDIGDTWSEAFGRTLSLANKWEVLRYQLMLATAWKLGGAWGDALSRHVVRTRQCPTVAPAQVRSQMAYPYAMQWFGALGGLRDAEPYRLHCPNLFIYGERKSTMWHSPQWVKALAARADSRAIGMPTGHWPMAEMPERFNRCVSDWLAAT